MLAPPRTSGETGVTVGRRLAALGSSGGRVRGAQPPPAWATLKAAVLSLGQGVPSLLSLPLVNKCGGTQRPSRNKLPTFLTKRSTASLCLSPKPGHPSGSIEEVMGPRPMVP